MSVQRSEKRRLADLPNLLIFVFATLTGGALVIYAPCLSGTRVWDDNYLVGSNPFFRSPIFLLEVFGHHLFLDAFSAYYRPLQNVTYIFDYWFWDDNTFGYHLANTFYHGASGCLLYLLLRRILPPMLSDTGRSGGDEKPGTLEETASTWLAFLIALVWVLHPIHNAAVAYISGRADSLASLFALSAWLMLLRGDAASTAARRALTYGIAAFCCLLALASKEIAIVWIAIFALHVCFFSPDRPWRSRATILVSLFAVLGLYLVLRHLPSHRPGVEGDVPEPVVARVLLMLRALGDYAGLIIFPRTLHMERVVSFDDMYLQAAGWERGIAYEYLSIIGLAVILFGLWSCSKRWPGWKLRIFGALWFCSGFLPISNLFPLNAQVAEHWIYMPSIGFLLFFGGCAAALPRPTRQALAWIVLGWAVALGGRTWVRSHDWVDAETFYRRTIEDGGGTPRVRVNLASAYQERGDIVGGERILRRTVEHYPGYATARIALGMNLLQQGRTEEANEFLNYDKATADTMARQFSYTWTAAFNLARTRYGEGKVEEAIAMVNEALVRFPKNFELLRLQARILHETKGPGLAIPLIERHAEEFWWHYETFVVLGRLKYQVRDFEGAIAAFSHAGSLDIHAGEPLHLAAHVEMARGRPEAAYAAEKKAIRRNPSKPTQLLYLSSILEVLGRHREAEEANRQARRLRDDAQITPTEL